MTHLHTQMIQIWSIGIVEYKGEWKHRWVEKCRGTSNRFATSSNFKGRPRQTVGFMVFCCGSGLGMAAPVASSLGSSPLPHSSLLNGGPSQASGVGRRATSPSWPRTRHSSATPTSPRPSFTPRTTPWWRPGSGSSPTLLLDDGHGFFVAWFPRDERRWMGPINLLSCPHWRLTNASPFWSWTSAF